MPIAADPAHDTVASTDDIAVDNARASSFITTSVVSGSLTGQATVTSRPDDWSVQNGWGPAPRNGHPGSWSG